MPERPEKIILAMHKLSGGSTKALKYEDIVVRAFEMFPEEFALRGYPQYPDSSDIHKPLYGPLKRRGMVRNANKTFALTERGVEVAGILLAKLEGKPVKTASGDRMDRVLGNEINKMLNSEAYRFFLNEQPAKILDTDFYTFLGCTVRSHPNDVLGRVNLTDEALKEAKRLAYPDKENAAILNNVWKFLKTQFQKEIERVKKATRRS
jgi:hypothetical protein